LISFLIKPIQRICKYPLLMREIVSFTLPTDPDYDVLKQVMVKFEEVTAYVNDHKRQAEKQHEMLQIAKKILKSRIPLISPTRSFIQSGPFIRVSENGKGREAHLFLFNDLLVETSKASKKGCYEYKSQYVLSSIQAKDHPDTNKYKNLFELRLSDKVDKKTSNIAFSASNAADRDHWIEQINKTCKDLTEQSKEKEQQRAVIAIKLGSSHSLSCLPNTGMPSTSPSPSRTSLAPQHSHLRSNSLNLPSPIGEAPDGGALSARGSLISIECNGKNEALEDNDEDDEDDHYDEECDDDE